MRGKYALCKWFPAILRPPDQQTLCRNTIFDLIGVIIEGLYATVLGHVPFEHVLEAPANDGCILAAKLGGPKEWPQHPLM